MTTAAQIIAAMQAAAPPGRAALRNDELAQLRRLTGQLVALTGDGGQELRRFLAARERGTTVPTGEIGYWLSGRTVLVIGGTGCIGTELMRQIAAYEPQRLVSVSRGVTRGWPRAPHAEYATADITHRDSLNAVFDRLRPDVVFHLAAQRDPGLAERDPRRTVTTNVFGTLNVIETAERFGAAHVVFASSGKAVRPYTPDVYSSSKRTAEWLLSRAATGGGCRYAAVRFTHIVDNSIIYQRLKDWCDAGVIRLHDPDTMFYVQSARESCQLLLYAGLSSRSGGLRVSALRDLGWPVSLLSLATGMLAQTSSTSPIYFSGHDPGYEGAMFPGLYDPRTAGDVSPLLNSFEAAEAEQSMRPPVDVFQAAHAPCPDEEVLLGALATACKPTAAPADVRAALAEATWAIFDATMSVSAREALARARHLCEPHLGTMSAEHRQMLALISAHEKARDLVAAMANQRT